MFLELLFLEEMMNCRFELNRRSELDQRSELNRRSEISDLRSYSRLVGVLMLILLTWLISSSFNASANETTTDPGAAVSFANKTTSKPDAAASFANETTTDPGAAASDDPAAIDVRLTDPIGIIDPKIYGHFTELTLSSFEGAIWSEQLFNRKFEIPEERDINQIIFNGIAAGWE